MDFDTIIRGPFILNDDGTIDCEFLNPSLGWVAFTASPTDPEDYGRAIHAYCLTKL